MSTTTTSHSNSIKPHRTGVSLKLPTKVPALITYAQGIVTGMTNNPWFPSPTPAVQSAITGNLFFAQASTSSTLHTRGGPRKDAGSGPSAKSPHPCNDR